MATTVACPVCAQKVTWTQASKYRPFCSERCKLIDLGAWASDAYRVEGPVLDELPQEQGATPPPSLQ